MDRPDGPDEPDDLNPTDADIAGGAGDEEAPDADADLHRRTAGEEPGPVPGIEHAFRSGQ
jgi:hypothetical protein